MGRRQPLTELVDRLTDRDMSVLRTLDQHRLMDGTQLRRLFFENGTNEQSNARLARLRLASLESHGLTLRLKRRVGGVRAGSAGSIWRITGDGQRLLAFAAGVGVGRPRANYEPGAAYVAHTLACSEAVVRLHEAARTGHLELVEYQPEPACWRRFTGGIAEPVALKPDGGVVAIVGEFEERALLEIDMATHGRLAIRRKLKLYADYQRSGHEQRRVGVFPRVLWLVPTVPRREVIEGLIGELPGDVRSAHQAVVGDELIAVLTRTKPMNNQPNGGET